jgi:Fur family ferric uptake transcriptional regulator
MVENWPGGVKKTWQRQAVLAVLEESETPVDAAEICSRTQRDGRPVWLSTVYRILELFVREGVAARVAVMNSDTARYELRGQRHRHYAVCVECHKVIPMENCPMDEFVPRIADKSFRAIGHNLEVYGYCGSCAAGEANALGG